MKKLLHLTLLLAFLFCYLESSGQNVTEKLITMKLDSSRFNDFVKQVEAQTD